MGGGGLTGVCTSLRRQAPTLFVPRQWGLVGLGGESGTVLPLLTSGCCLGAGGGGGSRRIGGGVEPRSVSLSDIFPACKTANE